MNHPREQDLALLAGGDAGFLRRFVLEHHVQSCEDCREKVAGYQDLRDETAGAELHDVNWSFLAAEMRANIRLGLEAGACVGAERTRTRWSPWPAVALACVLLLAVIGVRLQVKSPFGSHPIEATPVVQSTGSGVELRDGANSLMLLNHQGNAVSQVSARGDISAGYIDSETGSVTITNVSLQ